MSEAWGPIEFEPILVPRVWGGSRYPAADQNGPPIGESWDLADLPLDIANGRTRILRGPGAGGTLRSLIERDPASVLGRARPAADGGFPLLIKTLDAAQDLSVQVHPTRSFAAANPTARVKSEAWFVLAAEPGGRILRGFRPSAETGDRRRTADEIRAAATDGSIVDDLETIPAIPGECHVLPSGLCHALGAGVIVAEIQNPSDTTFRLFDWGRDGRTLHLDDAIACLVSNDAPHVPPPPTRVESVSGPPAILPLAQTDDFNLDVVEGGSGGTLPMSILDLPSVLIGVIGRARLEGPAGPVVVEPGRTILLPAAWRDATIVLEAGSRLLRATPTEDGRAP